MIHEPPGSPPPPYSCSGQNDSFSFRSTSVSGVAYIPQPPSAPMEIPVTLYPSRPAPRLPEPALSTQMTNNNNLQTPQTDAVLEEHPGSPPPPYSCSGQNDSFSFRSVSGVAYIPQPPSAPMEIPVTLYPSRPAPGFPEPAHSTQKTNNNNLQTPQTDAVLEGRIEWVSTTLSTARELINKALAAGKEGRDGSPYWVIRAHHQGDLVPGKFSIKNNLAFIPYGKKEVPVYNFEVLLAQPHDIRWVPSSHGQVPLGAIPAGNTQYGEPLYIARVTRRQYTTPGKVHSSHGCCYISYHGYEQRYKNYEVLCKNVE